MIRIVIVEDEMLVRLGLKACLESDPRFWVSGTFASAEEAVTYFETQSAEVLITDIRLAQMNGLELIRRLRPDHSGMVMILLTCYEDFSYAKLAVEYGANRYLLKQELDEAELPNMIWQMVSDYQTPLEPVVPVDSPSSWLQNNGGNVVAAGFNFRGRGDATNATGDDINLEMLSGIIRTVLEDYHQGASFIWRESRIIGLLHYDDTLSEGANFSRYATCFREITKSLEIYLDKLCFAGLSSPFSNVDELTNRVEQAFARCRLSFYGVESRMFSGQERTIESCPPLTFVRKDAYTHTWQRRTREDLEAFFTTCRNSMPPVEQVKETVMAFLHNMIAHGEQYFGLDRKRAYAPGVEPGYRIVIQFDSMTAMQGWMLQVIEQTIRDVQGQKDLTVKIREYLAAHYHEELLQADVAAAFHMSGPYFSQYFKENFGVNYIQYVNTLRIERAKLLLTTTRDSTESIAEKVGIPNVNYFFRLFKKMEGCTVKEFQRSHRNFN